MPRLSGSRAGRPWSSISRRWRSSPSAHPDSVSSQPAPPLAAATPARGHPDASRFGMVLERPVLSVGDHTYRWCDVVAFARASGEWEVLAATAARRAHAVATEPEAGRGSIDRDVQSAAVGFR